MLSALWPRRCYSTLKRTIPYVTKGNWKLPPVSSEAAPQANAAEQAQATGWGSRVASGGDKPAVNVPQGWRKIRTIPQWKKQMFALKEKFPQGWQPARKLSRDEMQELRSLKAAQPRMSNNELGSMFRISPEAVRRIVKSRWRADPETEAKLRERWLRRGVRLGSRKVQAEAARDAPRDAPRDGARDGARQRRAPRRLRDVGNDLF